MGRIKKCKLSWKPSESDLAVDYRLYWSNETPLGYNSNFIILGNITEVNLPDILADHESSGKSIYLGISAVDKEGNESDIITLREPYKLSAPTAPADLSLTSLDDVEMTDPREKAENKKADIQKQVIEKADQESQANDRRPVSTFITTEGKIIDDFDTRLRKTFKL